METNVTYVLIIILVLGIFLVDIYNVIMSRRLTKRKSSFTYNQDVNKAYDEWLLRVLKLYMVKYIDDYTGKHMVRDTEIQINADFANDGVDIVGKNIIKALPRYYRIYMNDFYGEEVFVDSIYELIRQAFTSYIAEERNRRLNGGVTKLPTSNRKEEQ